MTLVIAGPIALVRVVSHLAAWPGSERAGRSSVLHAVLLLQFFPLAYGLRNQIPDPRAALARAALIERLAELKGPVLVPGAGDAARQAGKDDAYQPLALDLLLSAPGNALLARDPAFADSMLAALTREPRPPLVVIGAAPALTPAERALQSMLERSYRRVGEWPELADSRAPRFVYAARMSYAAAPRMLLPPLAGAALISPDTSSAR